MKIIIFICDKCGQIVSTNRLNFKELEPHYLMGVGDQEWCPDCLGELNWTPDKNKTIGKIKEKKSPPSPEDIMK